MDMDMDPDMDDDMALDAEPTDDIEGDDDFGADAAAAGGEEPEERMKRESVNPRNLAKTLSKKK